MRICIVSHCTLPHVGGVETLSFEQARVLALRGHEVTIVSSGARSETHRELVQGVSIRRATAIHGIEKYVGIAYPIVGRQFCKFLCKELIDADVCIIHGAGFLTSLFAALICTHESVPYVSIQHGPLIRFSNPIFNVLQAVNYRLTSRYILRHASEILAVSKDARLALEQLTDRKVRMLYNGVDHYRFVPPVSRSMIRKALGLPVDRFIVLSAGRFVPNRSMNVLVQAAALLENDPRFLVLLAGTGKEHKGLALTIERERIQNCELLGAAPHATMPSLYQAADVFVLISQGGDGFPISILEAWASGIPVVATSQGEHIEAIRKHNIGFLESQITSHSLASLLAKCAANHSRLRIMGEEARRVVELSYTLEANVDRLLDVIGGVIRHAG